MIAHFQRLFIFFVVGLLFLALGLEGALAQESFQEFHSCPVGWQNLGDPHPNEAADIVLLVPGAGSQGEELFLGHFKWGRYFGQFQQELSRHSINSSVVASDKFGNENLQSRTRRVIQETLRWGAKGRRVLIVGHSMGGLAARLALRDSRLWPHVSGVITLSTPHRGTPLVDLLLAPATPLELVRRLLAFFGYDEKHKEYLRELSEAQAKKWDGPEDHRMGMPTIYSVLVSSSLTQKAHSVPPLVFTSEVLKQLLQNRSEQFSDQLDAVVAGWKLEDDGLVHLASQLWGRCLGRVEHDHGSVIGKTLGLHQRERFSQFVVELISLARTQNLLK